MKKRFMLVVLMVLAVFTLVACKGDELTAITFSGADDITVDFDASFNVLDGVTALGNDGVDYTDQITYTSTSTITSDVLDTKVAGQHAIKYEVEVGEVLAQQFRMVTVKDPVAEEGQMLVNADFSNGTVGWTDNAAFLDGEGSTLTLTTEEVDGDDVLKAEVVSGWEPVRPRFGQLNIPFEKDKTYEISYDAKSSVEKTIQIQLGELLPAAPWITDFIPMPIKQTIDTEWDTYSFKFTMNLDNQKGGLLFGLGQVDGEAINATMWFDNFEITETTPDVDETAPVFSGIKASYSIVKGGTFDPLAGVSALDFVDGDVSDDIVAVITDSEDAVVATLDTSEEATYTITYTVSDAAGNEATATATLEVVGILFNETNLVTNGDFSAALGDPAEWGVWSQDWDAAPVVTTELDTTAGTYEVDITGGGQAAWAVQFSQTGIMLEEGSTYKITAEIAAEVARKINVAVGYGDPWVEYARFDGQSISVEGTTLELMFTVTKPTHAVNLVFELGTQEEFADGTVTFSDVKLQEAILDDIITNGQMNDGWTFYKVDGNTATYNRNDGMFNITTETGGSATYEIQINQALDLEAETTYVLSFDAKASAARDIFVKLFKSGVWIFYVEEEQMLTTDIVTYTFEFTTGTDNFDGLTVAFEAGATTNYAPGTVSIDNISVTEKDLTDAPELIVNGDATTVPNFSYDNAGGGTGTMVLGEDGAVIDVTALGAEAYQPHFYQMIDSLLPGNYVLKLVMDSSVDRDLRINMVLPDAGYNSIFPDGSVDFEVISTETNVVYVEFVVTAEVTNVKLELDFGTLGGDLTSVVGEFTIQEVLVYQDFN